MQWMCGTRPRRVPPPRPSLGIELFAKPDQDRPRLGRRTLLHAEVERALPPTAPLYAGPAGCRGRTIAVNKPSVRVAAIPAVAALAVSAPLVPAEVIVTYVDQRIAPGPVPVGNSVTLDSVRLDLNGDGVLDGPLYIGFAIEPVDTYEFATGLIFQPSRSRLNAWLRNR